MTLGERLTASARGHAARHSSDMPGYRATVVGALTVERRWAINHAGAR